MADEATITVGLSIVSGHLDYQSRPASFVADVAGSKGPVPGAISASSFGTDVDLSELTQPGLCRVQNLDATNVLEVGAWDPTALRYYPILELLPGESYVFRLSRNLSEEYGTGTGTGTLAAGTGNRLRLRKSTGGAGTINALVEAFET